MPTDSQLQKAYRQAVLWPPIHAAIDVFLRRRAAGAEPFELTWRLIHIWECTVITLAGAAVSRFLAVEDADSVDKRLLREKLFGVSWDPAEQALETVVGALPDGSIDKWIEILQFVVSLNPEHGEFLPNLVRLLSGQQDEGSDASTSNLIDLSPLVTAWSRACEVTQDIKGESVPLLAAMRAVNSFRNRLAHVPFPFDAMRDIASGLSSCTERLFTLAPVPTSGAGPLAGAIVFRDIIIQGAATNETQQYSETGPLFVFKASRSSAGEFWSAVPFIHIDGMFRPYMLTRMKLEAADWEYTRYLAEANAVLTLRDRTLCDVLPIPSRGEYEEQVAVEEVTEANDGEPTQASIARDMGDVSTFIKNRNFAPAIAYLEERTQQQPHYHVGWLRLGHARRELAVDALNRPQPNVNEVRALIDASLDALHRAKGHASRDYRSEAEYHTSKSLYRRWRLDHNGQDLANAIVHSEDAVRLNPLQRYFTWADYLRSLSVNGETALD